MTYDCSQQCPSKIEQNIHHDLLFQSATDVPSPHQLEYCECAPSPML